MQALIFRKTIIGGIIIACLFLLTKIEYDNFKLSGFVYPLLWISTPFIFRYILINGPISRVSFLLGIFGYLLIIFLFSLFSSFCSWSRDVPLYKSRRDKSLIIVCRTYDCYGTTEDCRLYQVKMLTNHIKWVVKFEEIKVDSSKWQ